MKFDPIILDTVRMEEVIVCPLCRSHKRELFTEEKIGDRVIQGMKCQSCGLIYMTPVVVSDDIHILYQFYNNKRNEQDIELAKRRLKMQELDYKYIQLYTNDTDTSVLDIGCGDGGFLNLLPKQLEKYGVEVDTLAVDEGRKKYPDILFSKTVDVIAADQIFDSIIFRGTLQYMPDLEYISDFCRTHLKTAGRIIFLATPNVDSILTNIQKEHWALWNSIEHRYCFGLHQIELLFKDFKVVDYSLPYMGTPYENYQEDFKKILTMFDNPIARKEKVPFFGSMMNVVIKKRE